MVTGKEYGVSKVVTEEKEGLKYGYGRKKGLKYGYGNKLGSQIWLWKQIGVSKMVTGENFP